MSKTIDNRRIFFIVGPTAIGKTSLGIRLAKKLKGEIISCDSMQVYKDVPILSQAPTASQRKMVRHYLVGFRDPSKEYSVALYRKEATKAIDAIVRRKRVPILVGGSGLYMKALIDGLFPTPKADLVFRANMEKYAKRYGSGRLYDKLLKIDAMAAAKIHPNDIRRTIRALEIFHTTGKTMTELKANTKGLKDMYDIRIYGIIRPREEIYERIDRRVDEMLKKGAVRETAKLIKKRLSKTAGAILGLTEIRGYLNGEYDLDVAKEMLKLNTRRFAKRQLTWFRADKRIVWIDAGGIHDNDVVNAIIREQRIYDN